MRPLLTKLSGNWSQTGALSQPSQVDSKGDSIVSFVVNAVTGGDGDYLRRWIDNRLN